MLKTLKCNQFANDKTLKFSTGLNLIMGDDQASNSIGKSTFLMIIDFIFGGNDYMSKNGKSIEEIGDQVFEFSFIFGSEQYYFKRNTEQSKIIIKCDKDFKEIEELTLRNYTDFLKEKYSLESFSSTFRDLVSLYGRVWGRKNLSPEKPLASFPSEKQEDSMNRLIKLFNKYDQIASAVKEYQETEADSKALKRLFKNKYLKEITKKQYDKNLNLINDLDGQLNFFKKELQESIVNIEDIKNKKLLEKYKIKRNLTQEKNLVETKIKKIEREQLKKSSISKQEIEKIEEFFPNINKEKVIEIEAFHSNLSKILSSQMNKSKKELLLEKDALEKDIESYNEEILLLQEKSDLSPEVLEKLESLSRSLNTLKKENENYTLKTNTKNKLKEKEENKFKQRDKILDDLSGKLNWKMSKIAKKIDSIIKSPIISFSEKSYTFETGKDTGTGKTYENFIILDIAILLLTELPYLIHDSILFKHIEVLGMEKLLSLYSTFEKNQIFISIDEMKRYNNKTKELILKSKVIEVSRDTPLFGRSWRNE